MRPKMRRRGSYDLEVDETDVALKGSYADAKYMRLRNKRVRDSVATLREYWPDAPQEVGRSLWDVRNVTPGSDEGQGSSNFTSSPPDSTYERTDTSCSKGRCPNPACTTNTQVNGVRAVSCSLGPHSVGPQSLGTHTRGDLVVLNDTSISKQFEPTFPHADEDTYVPSSIGRNLEVTHNDCATTDTLRPPVMPRARITPRSPLRRGAKILGAKDRCVLYRVSENSRDSRVRPTSLHGNVFVFDGLTDCVSPVEGEITLQSAIKREESSRSASSDTSVERLKRNGLVFTELESTSCESDSENGSKPQPGARKTNLRDWIMRMSPLSRRTHSLSSESGESSPINGSLTNVVTAFSGMGRQSPLLLSPSKTIEEEQYEEALSLQMAVTEVEVFPFEEDTILKLDSPGEWQACLPMKGKGKGRRGVPQLLKSVSDVGEVVKSTSKIGLNRKKGMQSRTFSVDQTLSPYSPSSSVQQLQMSEPDSPVEESVESPGVRPVEIIEELSEQEKESLIKKRGYVLTELMTTETVYVEDLGLVVNGYMEEIKSKDLPDIMKGTYRPVFGNIHQIYEFHKNTFSRALEDRKEDAVKIGDLFVKYKAKLGMYVKYCHNKPVSECLVAELVHTFFEDMRQSMNQRLMITDLLIKPVQRIMKYQLLLKDILKYTRRLGEDCTSLEQACQVMIDVPNKANDMMNVGRLQGFSGSITGQGELRLQGTLAVCEKHNDSQKFRDRRLFLFQQNVIFSEEIPSKNALSPPQYIYKNHILVNKMCLQEWQGDGLTFELTDKSPDKGHSFLVRACDEQEKLLWIGHLKSMLERQLRMASALVNPVSFQKQYLGGDPRLEEDQFSNPKGKSVSPASNGSAGVKATTAAPDYSNGSHSNGSSSQVTKLFSRLRPGKGHKAEKDGGSTFYYDLEQRPGEGQPLL